MEDNLLANWGLNIASEFLDAGLAFGLEQYRYNQEQAAIEEQREYNTPLNQVRRLAEAGINPYSMGSQIVGGNVAQDHATPKFDSNQPFSKAMQGSINAMLAYSQIENSAQELKNKQAQEKLINAQAEGQLLTNFYNDASMQDRINRNSLTNQKIYLDSLRANNEISQSFYEKELKRLELEMKKYEFTIGPDGKPYYQSVYDLNYQKLDKTVDKINAEISLIYSRKDLTDQQKSFYIEKSLREQIARQYEEMTGTPWNSSNSKWSFINRAISSVAQALAYGNKTGFRDMTEFVMFVFSHLANDQDLQGVRRRYDVNKNKPSLGGNGSSSTGSW